MQCLSPAGEYNLRLGIIKELHPDMVATYSGRLYLMSTVIWIIYFIFLIIHLNEVGRGLSCSLFLYSAQVFEGHPFIVEAGVSLGGKDVKQVIAFLFPKHALCSCIFV